MYAKTLLSNLKVLGYDQQVHGDESFILDEQVFTKGANNSKAFQSISYFLFRHLNKRRAQHEFHDCWPVTNLKQATKYAQVAHKWLTELRDEYPMLSHVPLRKSIFTVCNGEIMNRILMIFSTAVLSNIVQKQVESDIVSRHNLNMSEIEFKIQTLSKEFIQLEDELDRYKQASQEKSIKYMEELNKPQKSTIDITHDTMIHVKNCLEDINNRLGNHSLSEITTNDKSQSLDQNDRFDYMRQNSLDNRSYSYQNGPYTNGKTQFPGKRTPTPPSSSLKRKLTRSPSPAPSQYKRASSPRVPFEEFKGLRSSTPTSIENKPSLRRASQQSLLSIKSSTSNSLSQIEYCCTLRNNIHTIMTRSQSMNDYYILPALTFSFDEDSTNEAYISTDNNEMIENKIQISPDHLSQQPLFYKKSSIDSHTTIPIQTPTDQNEGKMLEDVEINKSIKVNKNDIQEQLMATKTSNNKEGERDKHIPEINVDRQPLRRISSTEIAINEPTKEENQLPLSFQKPVSNETSPAHSPTTIDWASVGSIEDERPPDYFDAGLITPFRR